MKAHFEFKASKFRQCVKLCPYTVAALAFVIIVFLSSVGCCVQHYDILGHFLLEQFKKFLA